MNFLDYKNASVQLIYCKYKAKMFQYNFVAELHQIDFLVFVFYVKKKNIDAGDLLILELKSEM